MTTTQDLVERLLAHMGVEGAQITVEDGEFTTVSIQVSEEDSGLLIGYHGETIGSLQKVLQLMHLSQDDNAKRVVVNVNDYKQRREQQLREMTIKIADRILETNQSYVFGFLPANERLIVHKVISETPEYSQLESVSSGEGNARRLEIRFKQAE